MIVLYNPLSCVEGRRRLPLPLLALGSQLADADYAIVDGNVLGADAAGRAVSHLRGDRRPVLAVTAMPGNQLRSAILDTRSIRACVPGLRVVWGGYFPTLHADVVLRSDLVDAVVRGQGEETFVEWLRAERSGAPPAAIPGLSWKDADGIHHNPDRPFARLDGFPAFPYHKLGDMEEYVIRTYLGERTLCHITSRGCPFPCNFCAITEVYRRRWLAEDPDRVGRVAERFVRDYAIDSIEFFDGNFMADESRALAIADGLRPLGLRWWCQARIDTMNRYSEETWRRLRASGLGMMFFGAESGSDWVLARMCKQLRTAEILECARRCRQHGIVPEFSFALGNPLDPERDVEETRQFLYRLKRVSPECEVLVFVYTPVPQPGALFEDATRAGFAFPSTLEEWAEPRWVRFMSMKDPQTPWLSKRLRRRIMDLELVVKSRFPTATDIRFTRPLRWLLQGLASWRWATGVLSHPHELAAVHRLVKLRSPELQGFDAPPARRHRPPRRPVAAAAASVEAARVEAAP
ncbi:MAG: B12-binding domain-containing radical SAM protein [Acidobacteria bacterium]|nr:MAG: B12-binding domain-containing radical SAM protein [Acidobacteriota bacterium]